MEEKTSSQQGDATNLASLSHVEMPDDMYKEPESSEECGYQMTKVTYLAIIALYWSWVTVI